MVLFFLAMPKLLTKYRDSRFARLVYRSSAGPTLVEPARAGIPPLANPLHWLQGRHADRMMDGLIFQNFYQRA